MKEIFYNKRLVRKIIGAAILLFCFYHVLADQAQWSKVALPMTATVASNIYLALAVVGLIILPRPESTGGKVLVWLFCGMACVVLEVFLQYHALLLVPRDMSCVDCLYCASILPFGVGILVGFFVTVMFE